MIRWFPCVFPDFVAQLDKDMLQTIAPLSQPRYAHVEIFIIKKLENDNDWIIVKFLDNKTPQVQFDKIHLLIFH